MNRSLRDQLFEALSQYIEEEHQGRHTAAGERLGIPRWQMSRWFSKTGYWTNPQPHVLEKLVYANIDPMSAIALELLRSEYHVPLTFDFERASQSYGLSLGYPVALWSALAGNANRRQLTRTAAFDLVSAFVSATYYCELATAAKDDYHAVPVHPFGMTKLADPADERWPSAIGRPLLDHQFDNDRMDQQVLVVDKLLEAADRESNELYRLLEGFTQMKAASMASSRDIALAAIAAKRSADARVVAKKTAGVYRDAADREPALITSPIHRLASKIYEMNELTERYALRALNEVFRTAQNELGIENMKILLAEPNEESVPLVKRRGGSFSASATRSRTYASPLPVMRTAAASDGVMLFGPGVIDDLESKATGTAPASDMAWAVGGSWKQEKP